MTDAEARLTIWLRDYGPQKMPAFVADLETVLAELKRLRAGQFTEAEFEELCHHLTSAQVRRYEKTLEDFGSKIIGFKAPKDAAEAQRLKERYAGQTEPCCECGEDYPKGELVIDGHVFCAPCRVKEAEHAERRRTAGTGKQAL